MGKNYYGHVSEVRGNGKTYERTYRRFATADQATAFVDAAGTGLGRVTYWNDRTYQRDLVRAIDHRDRPGTWYYVDIYSGTRYYRTPINTWEPSEFIGHPGQPQD